MLKIKSRTEAIYSCFICILVFMYMMEASAIKDFNNSTVHDVLQLTALAMVFLYIIVRKYTMKELVRIFFLNLIGLLCFISSGYTGLLMTMLAITLLPKNSLDRILRMILVEETILLIGILIASQIGILSNQGLSVNKGAYMTEAKTLGFVHPNMFAAQATSILLLFLCVHRKRIKKEHIISVIVAVFMIFQVSKGRAAFILGFVAVILIYLQKKSWLQKIIFKVLPWMQVIVFVILVGCMFTYARVGEEASVVGFLNDGLFNGRIGLAYRSLLVYPITLFGKAIDTSIWNQWQYYSLDNGQVRVLLEFGIAGFVGYFWVIQKTLNQIKKEKEVVFAIIMIVFLIWSMYEGTMYFIGKNFALLFLGTVELGESKKIVDRGV